MRGRNWIAAAVAALFALPQFAAADYWRYETETGGVAFTDDPKSIPTKYRESASQIAESSLFDYHRLSLVEPVPSAASTQDRVERGAPAVPVFAWPVAEAAEPERRSRISLNVGGMQIDVDGAEDDDEPIYVDRSQYNDLNGDYIDHNGIMSPTTIIRRGDKPIAYIDER